MGINLDFTAQDGKKLLWRLIALEVLFVLIFAVDILFGPIRGINPLFDLDLESTIPAWFSSMQLFMIGILFLFISAQHKSISRPSPIFLLLIALGFIFLSADEAVGIHERVTKVLKGIEWIPRFKGNHGVWIPAYIATGIVFLLLAYREILAMWKNYQREMLLLIVGVGLFGVGAIGGEVIGYEFLKGVVSPEVYAIEVGIEEFMEMVGGSIMLYGALLLTLQEKKESLAARQEIGQPEELYRVS